MSISKEILLIELTKQEECSSIPIKNATKQKQNSTLFSGKAFFYIFTIATLINKREYRASHLGGSPLFLFTTTNFFQNKNNRIVYL